MDSKFLNPDILERLEELIRDGNFLYQDTITHDLLIRDPVALTQWATSCLNLFDKLSISTNRFVTEFEYYGRIIGAGNQSNINVGTALGVLKSAKEEVYYQVFIEPKGSQFEDASGNFKEGKEGWKETFLEQITEKYKGGKILKSENQNYKLIGLPLYNAKNNLKFKKSISENLALEL